MNNKWTANDIPDLHGRVALVTGANSGLGLETTRVLASQGAKVIMACRSLDKARLAEAEIRQTVADADIEVIPLDLSSLASVRECAATFAQVNEHLDLLFNNAGIMAIPRSETADGFETQFGTNHLGHFALTGLLLPLLLATPNSRVVTTTSGARLAGRIKLDDLQRQRSYGRWEAYGQSKRANLLFTFELHTRLAARGATTISAAAHPGFATTNLQTTSATLSNARFERMMMPVIGLVLSQSALMGALPQLYAGISPAIHGGELVGPDGFVEMIGYPRIIRSAAKEYDRPLAAKLWEASEKLTGVTYDALRAPAQITSAQS
jgi:NAD(P)-dependent dehydrogenase (short-subunit alcohol dehydrogenase family)